METHEGIQMGRRLPRRARLVTAAIALISAFALAVPGVAGAYTTFGSRSTSSTTSTPAPISLTITQNTSMIVVVSGTTSTTADATVSWSDVSWSDSTLVN